MSIFERSGELVRSDAHPEIDASLNAIAGEGGVVVLAPHPDDETLGCGALLAACFASGRPAHVIVITDGSRSHPASTTWPPERIAEQRQHEAIEAVCALGGRAQDVTFLAYPDGHVPTTSADLSEAADKVLTAVRLVGARILLSTGPDDDHVDHRATAKIAAKASARLPGLRVLQYPIWPPEPTMDGMRAHHFPLGQYAERKLEALKAHKSQLGELVTDDPTGFVLPADFIAAFFDRDEIFMEPADALRNT